jgi:fucose 4-O-acetylase-like acetyltransferase
LNRVVALDIVKAIAICLLVLGHVIEGLSHMGVIGKADFLLQLQDWLRSVRMPSFFFAAGAVMALRPLPSAKYFLRHRFATLAYPHLVWGTVGLIIAILFARYHNSPIEDPGNIVRHLVELVTGQRSWFLAALFLVSVVAYYLFRIDARLALAIALLLCLLPIDSSWRVVLRSFDYGIFFVLGYLVIAAMLRVTMKLSPWHAAALSLAILTLSVAMYLVLPPISHPLWGGISLFLLGLIGTAGIWLVSVATAATGWPSRILAGLGTASLAIFVLHPMAIGATRLILLPLLRDTPSIVPTLIITILGVLLPAAAYYSVKAMGLVTPIFILPLPQTEAPAEEAPARQRA